MLRLAELGEARLGRDAQRFLLRLVLGLAFVGRGPELVPLLGRTSTRRSSGGPRLRRLGPEGVALGGDDLEVPAKRRRLRLGLFSSLGPRPELRVDTRLLVLKPVALALGARRARSTSASRAVAAS